MNVLQIPKKILNERHRRPNRILQSYNVWSFRVKVAQLMKITLQIKIAKSKLDKGHSLYVSIHIGFVPNVRIHAALIEVAWYRFGEILY